MSAPSIQQNFPFVPDYMSWGDWNGNLAIFYGEENIVFSDEDNWQTTAESMASMTAFAPYALPDPARFDNWQDWARAFTQTVNGQSY